MIITSFCVAIATCQAERGMDPISGSDNTASAIDFWQLLLFS